MLHVPSPSQRQVPTSVSSGAPPPPVSRRPTMTPPPPSLPSAAPSRLSSATSQILAPSRASSSRRSTPWAARSMSSSTARASSGDPRPCNSPRTTGMMCVSPSRFYSAELACACRASRCLSLRGLAFHFISVLTCFSLSLLTRPRLLTNCRSSPLFSTDLPSRVHFRRRTSSLVVSTHPTPWRPSAYPIPSPCPAFSALLDLKRRHGVYRSPRTCFRSLPAGNDAVHVPVYGYVTCTPSYSPGRIYGARPRRFRKLSCSSYRAFWSYGVLWAILDIALWVTPCLSSPRARPLVAHPRTFYAHARPCLSRPNLPHSPARSRCAALGLRLARTRRFVLALRDAPLTASGRVHPLCTHVMHAVPFFLLSPRARPCFADHDHGSAPLAAFCAASSCVAPCDRYVTCSAFLPPAHPFWTPCPIVDASHTLSSAHTLPY